MIHSLGVFYVGMTQETNIQNRPVSLAYAARHCGIKSTWLRTEAEDGRLPGFKAGDRWLFDLPKLENALSERVRREGSVQ